MARGLLGKKVGMTQIFSDKGEAIPVTVIEVGPCVVVQKKTVASDGYEAIQLGFEPLKERKVNKPLRGHFSRAQVKAFRYLREFRIANTEAYEVGQELKVDTFVPGDQVDVTGVSKGKGFAGGIKRHGFHRGPMKHGSKYHRRPGTLGAKGPARVFKGRKLPGHMGGERTTVRNLKVVGTDLDHNLLLIKGSVPGPCKSLLFIKAR
jgi:large subunit ribosomal protein L3